MTEKLKVSNEFNFEIFENSIKKAEAVLQETRRLIARGMTEEELENMSYLMVAPGITVQELIEARIDFEEIEWKEKDGVKVLVKKSPR